MIVAITMIAVVALGGAALLVSGDRDGGRADSIDAPSPDDAARPGDDVDRVECKLFDELRDELGDGVDSNSECGAIAD